MVHLLQFLCSGQCKFGFAGAKYRLSHTLKPMQLYCACAKCYECFKMVISSLHCLIASTCSTSAAIRLYSGYSSTPKTEGAVQICSSGQWYSVCDVNWDCADGNVACRELGLGKASKCIILVYIYIYIYIHHKWH